MAAHQALELEGHKRRDHCQGGRLPHAGRVGAARALLFEGTTQLDVAGFYYEYEDMQLGTFKGTLFEVDNVGEVEGYGVEA